MTVFLRTCTAAAICAMVFAGSRMADARLSRSGREASLTMTKKAQPVASEELPPPSPACCPTPCITYRNHGCQNVCSSAPPIHTVLQAKDPCTCCPINIPVCVPASCTDVPTVCAGRGFLGREVMWYDWCCGFSVKVTFKRTGDVIVTYVNR
jgi:hypothetical protein